MLSEVLVNVDDGVLTLVAFAGAGVGSAGASHRSSSTEQRGILMCKTARAVVRSALVDPAHSGSVYT